MTSSSPPPPYSSTTPFHGTKPEPCASAPSPSKSTSSPTQPPKPTTSPPPQRSRKSRLLRNYFRPPRRPFHLRNLRPRPHFRASRHHRLLQLPRHHLHLHHFPPPDPSHRHHHRRCPITARYQRQYRDTVEPYVIRKEIYN